MRTTLRLVLAVLCLSGGLFAQSTFTLHSSSVGGQATTVQEFNGFGCTGDNQSPQLAWENAPAGTQSFAVTIYDPDAPTGSGWWHWVVFDLPASTTELPAGAGAPAAKLLPAGAIQSLTDYGAPGYGGPCPPPGHGPHQYLITVYALGTPKLGLTAENNPATVGFYLGNNTLAKASIVMYYERE